MFCLSPFESRKYSMARRITLLEQWTAIVRNFSDHFSVVFSILYINTYEISLTLARDERYFCEINEMSSRMSTYKDPQILDKVCKVTWQKQIKYYDFIPFFDFQYEKNIFNCQPSHFSPCSAVPEHGHVYLTIGLLHFMNRLLNQQTESFFHSWIY